MTQIARHWIGGRSYPGYPAPPGPSLAASGQRDLAEPARRGAGGCESEVSGRLSGAFGDATFDSAAISGMYFEKLAQIAEEEGVCVTKTLAALGLHRSAFCTTHRFSYRQFYAFIQALEDQDRIAAVGLKLGHKEGPLVDGFLGYACSSAADLRQSLLTYIRFTSELGVDLQLTLTMESGAARLDFTERYPLGRFMRFSVEEILGHIARVCEHLRGGKLRCTRASFSYERPDYAHLYEALLGCRVYFGEPSTRIDFAKTDLDLPFLTANDTIYRICLSHCESLYRRFATSGALAEEVRRIVLIRPGAAPKLEDMAGRFHMATRTFRRCLTCEGTSYHEIVHRARMTVAADYLTHTTTSPREISDWLGYQEIASFYRNFKSWAGMTPKQYREAHVPGRPQKSYSRRRYTP